MKRILLTTFLLLAAPAAAHAAITPSLSIDTHFAPVSGIAVDNFSDAIATDIPAEVLVSGERTYTIGSTSSNDGNIVIVARRADGTFDTGFSGDGKLTVSIPGTEGENVKAATALPDGSLRIAANTDTVIGTGGDNRDIALIAVRADGTMEPGFGANGIVVFGVGAGKDEPMGIAVDAVGRVAVSGTAQSSNLDDTFVALRNADGTPAGFGTAGAVVLPRAPLNLGDIGQDVVFRPGGGLVVLMNVHTNPVSNNTDETSVLRAFNEDGSTDTSFGSGGETPLTVGDPDTSSQALLVHRGRIWVTGKTSRGVQQNAFVARVEADGNGLVSRQLEFRGKVPGTEAVASSATDLVVVSGPPETLFVVGSSVRASTGSGAFAAGALSNFDADLAVAPFGSYVDSGSNQSGLLSAAAAGATSVMATGLLLDSSLAGSFATMRFLLDADKKCDLAIDVPSPLELTFVGRKGTAAQVSVENKGERPCGGDVTVNAPYKLGRAVSTGLIEPGAKFVANAVPVTTSTIRRDDDVARFGITVAGDADTSNDVRGVRAVFSFCDLALSTVQKPATIPNEGGRRVEVGLRNSGTRTCRSVRMRVTGGSGAGVSKPYSIERGRSVSDDVSVSAASRAKIGKKATVRVTSSSADEDIASGNDSIRLTARVVGVGDSRVRSASATRISGSATGGKGTKADRAGLRLTRVEVAVRKLGGGCRWLSGNKFKKRKTSSCTPSGWRRASGKGSWSLNLRTLPAGRYEVYTRAVTANTFREGRFSTKDGNRRAFRVR
jgi:hypothetical protein